MTVNLLTLLGFIQGFTEFLPVSSSGHLILTRELFGFGGGLDLSIDAVLHFATALAILFYFRREFGELLFVLLGYVYKIRADKREETLLISLLVATIPATMLGYFLAPIMATVFRSPFIVAGALLFGSILFVLSEWFAKQNKKLSIPRAVGIGLFQTLSLIPGMSRSGMSIVGGLLFGLSREDSARFSFMLALPILLGAGAKQLIDLTENPVIPGDLGVGLLVAGIVAFLVSVAAIYGMLRFVREYPLYIFALYRTVLAFGILFILL